MHRYKKEAGRVWLYANGGAALPLRGAKQAREARSVGATKDDVMPPHGRREGVCMFRRRVKQRSVYVCVYRCTLCVTLMQLWMEHCLF